MSDEPYKMVMSIGGLEIVASGPDGDWVEKRFLEMFMLSAEPAKKIPTGFSVHGGQLELDYER